MSKLLPKIKVGDRVMVKILRVESKPNPENSIAELVRPSSINLINASVPGEVIAERTEILDVLAKGLKGLLGRTVRHESRKLIVKLEGSREYRECDEHDLYKAEPKKKRSPKQ